MAFMQNYGRGLNKINQAPRMQGAAMLAQSFQNVGQSVATAMKDYQAKKEQKEKKQQLAKFYEGQFAANPEQAAKLGIDVNDPKSLAQGSMAAASNPEGIRVAMEMQRIKAQDQQMQLQREAADRQKADAARKARLAPLHLQAAEQQVKLGGMQLENQATQQNAKDLLPFVSEDGRLHPDAYKADPAAANLAIQMKAQQDLARRGAETDILNKESLIEYRNLSARSNLLSQQAAALKAQFASTDVSKEIEGIQKQLDNIQDNPITVRLKNGDKVQRTFRDIVEGKVEDIDPKSESQAFVKWKTIHEGLQEKQLQFYKQIPATYYRTNKKTGETEIVQGTMADKLEYELALLEQKEKEEKDKKSKKDSSFYKPPTINKKPFIKYEGKPVPFLTPSGNDVDVGIAP